jgi:hypothetical protein
LPPRKYTLIFSVQINALLPKHLLMQPFNTFISRHGQITLYFNEKGRLLLAQPSGYISPQLLLKELNFLRQFAAQQTRPWKYVVDLTEVRFAYPFNPFLLRRFKRLHQLHSYTAYSPSRLLRFAIKMTAWINPIDDIIPDKLTFLRMLNSSLISNDGVLQDV